MKIGSGKRGKLLINGITIWDSKFHLHGYHTWMNQWANRQVNLHALVSDVCFALLGWSEMNITQFHVVKLAFYMPWGWLRGRKTPKEAPQREYCLLNETVGLLLFLNWPIWGTSKVVVLDSWFCVFSGYYRTSKEGSCCSCTYQETKILTKVYWLRCNEGIL